MFIYIRSTGDEIRDTKNIYCLWCGEYIAKFQDFCKESKFGGRIMNTIACPRCDNQFSFNS